MSPYYERHNIAIYHGDCRDVIPYLPPADVQLVLTDPPYSQHTYRGARTTRRGAAGRLIDFPAMEYLDIAHVFSLCAVRLNGWLVSFADWRHVAALEAVPPPGLRFIRLGIWDKPNGTPQLSGDRPAQGFEAIALLHTASGRMNWQGGGARAVWSCPKELNVLHPAQKPLRLIKQLICLFSLEGSLILDPFCGAGTTLRAALDLGSPAIGIEREERYCEIAANRLAQRTLFPSTEPTHGQQHYLL